MLSSEQNSKLGNFSLANLGLQDQVVFPRFDQYNCRLYINYPDK